MFISESNREPDSARGPPLIVAALDHLWEMGIVIHLKSEGQK